ncbi:MAG: ABC transporter substrate-binding protein [Actinobacteria bacterium]|nr:ABC transporter substrate-binding protein [Actinomycetota bacterium]
MTYRFPRLPRAAAAAAAALALLAAGCSASSGQASPPQVEKHNLIVAAVPAADSAGLYIAAQRGLFKAQGLNVTIKPAVSSATVISQQLDGKIDASLGNYVSYILADAQHNAKLRILAAASVMGPNVQELLVPAGSPIHNVRGLAGKTIGVNVLNNIGTLLITSVLSDNAMQPQKDHVHFKAIEFPAMAQALQKHEVNAAWLPEPFVTGAEETIGAQPLADTDQGTTQNFPIGGLVVTQSWEKKYPKTAAAFRRAFLAGQQIAATDPAAVQKGMQQYAHLPVSTAAIETLPTFPLTTDARSIQRIADLMLRFDMLRHAFDTRQMLH